MQVNLGKVHKYLGIVLDYTTVFQVKITVLGYIYEILDTCDKADPTGGNAKSSVEPGIILKVNEDCKQLNAKQAVEFHHLVAKILFSTKWDRPDTYTKI